MASLSRHDKDLIVEIVREILVEEPEELEVFEVTSEDLLQQAASRGIKIEADSDAFFGDLQLSMGELLVHILVAVAIDCAKHVVILSRDIIRKRLEARLRDKGLAKVPVEVVPVLEMAIAHLKDETTQPSDQLPSAADDPG